MYKNNLNIKKGFTLIELLVSLTILSIVVMLAFGALINITIYLKQARAERRVVDNLNFAIESMSRSVAYGTGFEKYTFPDCTDSLSFSGIYIGMPNRSITFHREVDSNQRGYIVRSVDNASDVKMTDDSIDIDALNFCVTDVAKGMQPLITVIIHGTSYATSNPQTFNIQTSISQRDLNL